MRKLGLDPARLKLVIVTHYHGDHSGGMRYFAKKGVKVMVSEADWGKLGGAPSPDSVLHDGQVITIGRTPITIVLTPGHTEGTISVLFPVFDRGARHMAVLLGGAEPRGDAAVHQIGIDGMTHLRTFTERLGADVVFDPHEVIFNPVGLDYVVDPKPLAPGQPNPYIIGRERLERFSDLLTTCWRARIAIMREKQSGASAGR